VAAVDSSTLQATIRRSASAVMINRGSLAWLRLNLDGLPPVSLHDLDQ